jgi:hypothetical protein
MQGRQLRQGLGADRSVQCIRQSHPQNLGRGSPGGVPAFSLKFPFLP